MTAFYTIIGGSVPEVVNKLQTSPAEDCNHLSPANNNKGTSRAEANAALDLHKDFQYHKHTQADQQPETFAKPIGPFYAVYNGKTESVIMYEIFLDYPHANAHWFGSIKDALVYMILQGDMNKMKALALVPSNNTHGFLWEDHTISLNTPNTKLDSIVMKRVHKGPYFFFNCGIYFGNPKIYQQTTITTTTGDKDIKEEVVIHYWSTSTLQDRQDLLAYPYTVEGAAAVVKVLGSKGMAAAEVHWLWDLIWHDDDYRPSENVVEGIKHSQPGSCFTGLANWGLLVSPKNPLVMNTIEILMISNYFNMNRCSAPVYFKEDLPAPSIPATPEAVLPATPLLQTPLPAIKPTTPTAIPPQPAPLPSCNTISPSRWNQQEETDQVMLGSYFLMKEAIDQEQEEEQAALKPKTEIEKPDSVVRRLSFLAASRQKSTPKVKTKSGELSKQSKKPKWKGWVSLSDNEEE
ncbi:hypothetical protein C8J57DRAFT_1252517 [Mycena rebaudengoi]|nr:hypothetical protein C8J57DRAFT_1252517 [Mycena rebaudengoi]